MWDDDPSAQCHALEISAEALCGAVHRGASREPTEGTRQTVYSEGDYGAQCQRDEWE